MAKKFMYVCIGIMALAVTFHIGAEYGKASIVDHSMTGIVAEGFHPSFGYCVLLDNSEVWRALSTSPGWGHLTEYDLPIPVTQVKFWPAPTHFYTVDNEFWYKEGSEWVNYGAPPGGVATQPTTWGKIKAEWGE